MSAPYSAETWRAIRACGEAVEASLGRSGVAISMGGEPTFVPTAPRGAEWQTAALGPTKLGYARRLARERNELRRAAESVSRETLAAGQEEQRVAIAAIEANAQLLRALREAGALAAAASTEAGDGERRAALEALAALRNSATVTTQAAVEVADREHRRASFVSGPGRYLGHAPVAPDAIAKPVLHLMFDGTDQGRATAAPGGAT